MAHAAQELIDLKKEHDFLVCVDSDGCAFDSMEIKHKECFIPNTINYWGLQSVSKYAREAAEFVNLYSKWRGINRFPALIETLELTANRAEAKARGFVIPETAALRRWMNIETKLGNPALEAEVAENHDPVMERTLDWSKAVNRDVEKIVRDVPPFPGVRESLELLQAFADVIVVSATPGEALEREWAEHDITKYVKVVAGQEMGTKAECIALAKNGRYADDHILMVGDAPGDLSAARKNGVLFYPINPGNEELSWTRFINEAHAKFLNGTYAGAYEESLIAEFETYLPESPPWKKG